MSTQPTRIIVFAKTPAPGAVLIGTDCPAMSARLLERAIASLDRHDAALCPTVDGGYALLGLRRIDATLFSDIPWSTAQVATQTLQRLQWSTARLETVRDIDEPADLAYVPRDWLGNGLLPTDG